MLQLGMHAGLRRISQACLVGLIAAFVGNVAGALHADAQTTQSEKSGELTEIVVTAERRESTVQQTPFSITAITGEQLTDQGLSRINEVAAQVPGISIRSSGPGQTEYEMRGLSSSGGSSATVGLYLNDVPLSAPAAAFDGKVTIDPDLFDLDRVEVLRGPQGTLYGSGSMGGTIRLLTSPANLNKFETAEQTILSGTTGGGFNRGGSAMVNLPVIDERLAVRLVGTYKYTDGWIDRIVLNPFPIGPGGNCGTFSTCTRGDVQAAPVQESFPGSNREQLYGGRGTVLFKPTDALSVDLLLMYQRLETGGFSQADDPPGVDALAHYQPFDIPEPFDDTFSLYSLTINDDFSFARLTSATSYFERRHFYNGDASEPQQSFDSYPQVFNFQTLIPLTFFNTDTTRQTTEELRFVSTGNGRLQWLVGGFYSKFESIFDQHMINPAIAFLSVGGAAANPQGIYWHAYNPYHIKQYALFAESSYRITDAIKATVGLRGYKFDTDLAFSQAGLVAINGNATPFTGQIASSASGVNPKFNLSYQPNGNLTLYAEAAKGFRPGGLNIPAPVSLCGAPTPLSYAPDSLWNYEVGEKAKLLDQRLTVNADIYYIRWNNVQQFVNQPCGYPFTVNAGTAVSYGPELEVAAQLTRDLSISVNGVYTDAHIQTVNAAIAGLTLAPGEVIAPGLSLLNVPRYTVNAAIDYGVTLADAYKLKARVDATRIGPLYDVSYTYTHLPAYTLINARLGLFGRALVPSLFIDNLTNKHAAVSVNTQTFNLSVPSVTRAAVNTPRTFGIDLEYRF